MSDILSQDEVDALLRESKPQQETPPSTEIIFEELKSDRRPTQVQRDMDFLLDVPLEIKVELGRTRTFIKDLLQLGQGSVIELDKAAGEPMDILVNGKLVARGEIVVVNEKFGIRLTDIISPTERNRQLK